MMLRALERFLLPNVCICCESLIAQDVPDDLVCGVCCSRMRAVGAGCLRCSHPLPPVGPCRFCSAWTESLVEVKSAVWLDDEARKVVHQLKYGHAQRLASLIADVVVKILPKPTAAVLVPVPVASNRFRERGYNQAALIGVELAKRWQLTFLPNALKRVTQTRSQTVLTPQRRAANVASAFEGRTLSTARIGNGSVVIVDDVLTTGATIDACARALQKAGWKTIRTVTFARANTYSLNSLQRG